jgi:hypothetical protein
MYTSGSAEGFSQETVAWAGKCQIPNERSAYFNKYGVVGMRTQNGTVWQQSDNLHK